MELPIEILERIFNFMNGKVLLNSRKVSKFWKNIIDAILLRYTSEQWHWLCLETIPPNSMIEYLNVGHPPIIGLTIPDHETGNQPDLSWVNWKTIFKNHQMLNNATRWNRSKKFSFEIDLQDNPVTSVRVTGDFVLTGHFSGILCLWTQDRGFLIDFCDFAHNDVITDMVVGDVFNKGPYILGREDQKDIRYLSKHHFVISASIDGHVHVRGLGLSNIDSSGSLEGVSETMNLDQHSVPGVYLSLIGNSLATFSRDNTVTLWEISVPDHFRQDAWKLPRFLPVMNVRGPRGMNFLGTLWPNKFGFWKDKFTVLTRDGLVHTMYFTSNLLWVGHLAKKPMTLVDVKTTDSDSKKLVKIMTGRPFEGRTRTADMVAKSREELINALGHVVESYNNTQLDLAGPITWARLFHDDLFVLVTKRRQLMMSVDGCFFRLCNPFEESPGHSLSCVLFYANVLILGSTGGHIWAYFTKDSIDLMSKNMQNPDVLMNVTQGVPIVGISVDHGLHEGLTLAVACESDLHIVQLKPPSKI